MAARRLDLTLVDRGLAGSRSHARRLIHDGSITVDGVVVLKPAHRVAAEARLERVPGVVDYVSRGGRKLDAALAHFGLHVTGMRALDVGASTGGFTDCLLTWGAAAVVSVDVGSRQLHPRLRDDPRVESRERTDVRTLDPLAPPAELAVVDVSFIRLRDVLPAVARAAPTARWMLALLKPQFELPGAQVPRDGVIKDPLRRTATLLEFLRWCRDTGFTAVGAVQSPVSGGDGNRETFVLLRPPWPE